MKFLAIPCIEILRKKDYILDYSVVKLLKN